MINTLGGKDIIAWIVCALANWMLDVLYNEYYPFKWHLPNTNTITLIAKIEYKVWMFLFKQPYHEHQSIKSKSVNMKVVVWDILHATMEVWRKN